MRKKHIIVIPRFLYPMVLEDQRWTGPGTQGREVFVDGGVEVAAFASCKSLASSEGVTKPPWNMALNNRAKETEKNARFARYRHNSNSYCIYASSGFSYSCLALFIKHRTSAPKCWSRCVFDRKPSLLWGNVLLFFFPGNSLILPQRRWRQWSTTSWCNSRTMLGRKISRETASPTPKGCDCDILWLEDFFGPKMLQL